MNAETAMQTYETIRVETPYKSAVARAGENREGDAVAAFDVIVPAVPRSDVKLAARAHVRINDEDRRWVDFVDIDGSLFRPYLVEGQPQDWTLDARHRSPPRFCLDGAWGTRGNRTMLMGSPFRPPETIQKRTLVRTRRSDEQVREETERRICALAAEGLRIVDGTLYQQTRTPGWAPFDRGTILIPIIPDLTTDRPLTLIDPRHSPEKIDAAARRISLQVGRGEIEVHDATLLPATIEDDAVGAFCLHTHGWFAKHNLEYFNRDFMTDLFALMRNAETAIRDGADLLDCYTAIDLMRAWERPDDSDLHGAERFVSKAGRNAALFLHLKEQLPPLPKIAPPADEADVEAVTEAFRR